MIYEDKAPVLKETQTGPAGYTPLHRNGSPEVSQWPAATKTAVHTRRRALLDKVHSFHTAAQLRAQGIYPYFRTISSAQDTEVLIEGKHVLMLGSNSYLGLTNHPKVKEAARLAVEKIRGWVRRFAFP